MSQEEPTVLSRPPGALPHSGLSSKHFFALPNQLTASRFVLAVILFILIALESWLWCLAVFALAAVTDWLDGYLARKQGMVSSLGRNFDPLVDKVLICGAYIFLLPRGTEPGWLTPWMVTVVVGRELIITGLRSFLENQGAVFGADLLGKIKMVLQCAALIAIFVTLYVLSIPEGGDLVHYLPGVRDVLVYAMLAATALSGLQYLWRATQLIRSSE
jgi:CDP-diacylglycerol--glycerol-3-phosphate 3-phosphatidyltransferase